MTAPELAGLPLVEGARLDHVAVAVWSLASGAALFRDVLGGRYLMGGEVSEQGFRFVQYRFAGGGKVELVAPMGQGFVSRFLDRRGEGVHHITLRVDGLEAVVRRLEGAGVPLALVDLDRPHWREAFIHPSNGRGVLIQLAESPHTEEDAARHMAERFSEAALLSAGPD